MPTLMGFAALIAFCVWLANRKNDDDSIDGDDDEDRN